MVVVYDKECPVCDAYCRAIQSGERPGSLHLVDARDRTNSLMEEITSRYFDIDQGMVVKLDGTLHYGADAIRVLAQNSNGSGMVGRVNRWLFSSQRRSEILYPVLRSARNLLLKTLGKKKINNLRLPHNSRF